MILMSIAAAAVGYLIGSIPTAWIVVRCVLGKDADIRFLGDGNMGATNAGQLLGPRWGTLVGAVDIFKGFAAVSAMDAISGPFAIGEYSGSVSIPGMIAGAACIVGHLWPVWLRFRGGRGAAVAIGVIGAVFTVPVLILTPPTALILIITRNTNIAFCLIYYLPLVAAKVIFGAEWGPILYCWILSFPAVLTDPRWKLRWHQYRFRKNCSAARTKERTFL